MAIHVTYSFFGKEQKANFQISKADTTISNHWWMIYESPYSCILASTSLLLAWCLYYFSVSCACCMARVQQLHLIIDNFWASTFHFRAWTRTPSGKSHWSRWPWGMQGQPSCWKGSCLGGWVTDDLLIGCWEDCWRWTPPITSVFRFIHCASAPFLSFPWC